MITILDVLENFISSQHSTVRSIEKMPGGALYLLGEEVRRFARDYILYSSGTRSRITSHLSWRVAIRKFLGCPKWQSGNYEPFFLVNYLRKILSAIGFH
jgi:hypothetical protein